MAHKPALPFKRFPIAVYLLAFMWILYGVDLILNISQWGIHPRSLQGVIGIVSAPWLHHNLYHLISNSLPFVILGSFIQWQKPKSFWLITGAIMLISGLGTWLFGSTGNHLGASGLVFGYWAYLITNAYYQRTVKAIVIAAITLPIYGGLIFGLFDMRMHISWSSHFFGAVAGFLVAKWLRI